MKESSHSPSCPLLVVGWDSDSRMAELLSAKNMLYRNPDSLLQWLGASGMKHRFKDVTRETVFRLAPSPHPGVMRPAESYGLIVSEGGVADTLFAESWKPLLEKPSNVSPLQDCLERLLDLPYHGLLTGPFAPAWECALSRKNGAYDTATIQAMAKAHPQENGTGDWIWLLLTDSGSAKALTGPGLYIAWQQEEQGFRMAPAPFLQSATIDSVVAGDLDADGVCELFVQYTVYYGDGHHTHLLGIPGQGARDPLSLLHVDVSGSSGEPGGSEIEGRWWLEPPFVYSSKVEAGKGGGLELDGVLSKEAYHLDSLGEWREK